VNDERSGFSLTIASCRGTGSPGNLDGREGRPRCGYYTKTSPGKALRVREASVF
jgi:hypothetical protein